jgi:hypothetical protein
VTVSSGDDGSTVTGVAEEPSITMAAPSPLTFVTAVGDADVETGSCIDGVCAVDPPR